MLAAMIFGFFALWTISDVFRAQTWQETSCTISSRSYYTRTPSRGATTFHPRIKYSYRAGEQDLTGERFNITGIFDSFEAAQGFIDAYSPGKQVACFYNPQNPSESVIVRSILQISFFKTFAGLAACLSLGVFLIYVSCRADHSRKINS